VTEPLPIDPDVDLSDPVERAELAQHPLVLLGVIAAGGALGAVLRWALGEAISTRPSGFPVSTLLINVSGCLAIGIFIGRLDRLVSPPRYLRPLVATGLLGGFTTFSTFAVEAVTLLPAQPAAGVGYLVATPVLAVAAAWAGLRLAGTRPAEVA
jgi:fluoride exporter